MIQKTTLQFLDDLGNNNNRQWFTEQKERYIAAKANVDAFGQAVYEEINKTDVLEKLTLYRIYKDVRFSKEKVPYNRHFGGRMVRATSYRRGGYYFHIEPGNTYFSGAFWYPNAEDLLRIRQEIAANSSDFKALINDKEFKKYFGELAGDKLKTAPKGFDKTHEAIDLLRFKQFVAMRHFTDNEVLSTNFMEEVVATYRAVRPFFDYVSVVLTTNENGEEI